MGQRLNVFTLSIRGWEKVARNGQRCPEMGTGGSRDEVLLDICEAPGVWCVSEATAPMDTGGREGFGQKAIETVDNLP